MNSKERTLQIPQRKENSGIWMMLASSVLFATGGLVLKWISWNPLAINGIRSFFGLCTIGLFIKLSGRKLIWNKTVLLGAFSYMVMTTLYVAANKMTSAANTIVLQYSCPVWIVIIEWLFYHKNPNKRQIYTLYFVFCGILCFFASSMHSGHIMGDFLALISGLFYGILFMINSMQGGDAFSSVFFGMCAGFVLQAPFALTESWNVHNLTVLGYLGIFQVGLAYVFFSLATSRIAPLQASLINGVEPVLNPTLAALFGHESLSWLQIIGAVIVIASIFFDSLLALKTEKQENSRKSSQNIQTES